VTTTPARSVEVCLGRPASEEFPDLSPGERIRKVFCLTRTPPRRNAGGQTTAGCGEMRGRNAHPMMCAPSASSSDSRSCDLWLRQRCPDTTAKLALPQRSLKGENFRLAVPSPYHVVLVVKAARIKRHACALRSSSNPDHYAAACWCRSRAIRPILGADHVATISLSRLLRSGRRGRLRPAHRVVILADTRPEIKVPSKDWFSEFARLLSENLLIDSPIARRCLVFTRVAW